MIYLIIGSILSVMGIITFILSNKLKIKRKKQQEQYELDLNQKITCAMSNLNLLNKESEITKLSLQRLKVLTAQEKNAQNEQLQKYREKVDNCKKQIDQEYNQYYINKGKELQLYFQNKIKETNKNYEEYKNQIDVKKEQLNKEIETIKNTLAAAAENNKREQQKKDKINFYKLSISESNLADVKMLENLKASFHKPVVLSKLIWSQYFQKQMTDLCNRVLNNKKNVCGIYKITDLITNQCYIGQSKAIEDRWKNHCKCGLGIDASTTNTLYNTMQRDKIWNFAFELLQECKPEQLNEKQAFWIDAYKSNIFGLNTLKGIKKT